MAWAKLHTDILADPKLMRASRRGARGLLLLPWLIAFAKYVDDDGRLTVAGDPAEPEDLIDVIPCTRKEDVALALEELTGLGVLVREEGTGVLRFHTWEERQGRPKPSDTPEAQRERKRKSRQANKKGGVTPHVTRDVTPTRHAEVTRDVTPNVTPPEKKRGEENRAEQQQTAAADPPDRSRAELLDLHRLQLTVQANNAITAKWGEQATPLYSSSGFALELATATVDAGIPLPFACQVIADTVGRMSIKPKSMTYFRAAIEEAWAKANDPALSAKSDAPAAGGMARASEVWRILRTTGLHHAAYPDREGIIASHVARGTIPDERGFREAWGTMHVSAATKIKSARTDEEITRALWPLILSQKQEPYPPHIKLPHPWLDWLNR